MATPLDYAAVLADMRQKRAAIDAVIQSLLAVMGQPSEIPQPRVPTNYQAPLQEAILDTLKASAETYMSPREIARRMVATGLFVSKQPKKTERSVATTLGILLSTGQVIHARYRLWGLPGWTPPPEPQPVTAYNAGVSRRPQIISLLRAAGRPLRIHEIVDELLRLGHYEATDRLVAAACYHEITIFGTSSAMVRPSRGVIGLREWSVDTEPDLNGAQPSGEEPSA